MMTTNIKGNQFGTVIEARLNKLPRSALILSTLFTVLTAHSDNAYSSLWSLKVICAICGYQTINLGHVTKINVCHIVHSHCLTDILTDGVKIHLQLRQQKTSFKVIFLVVVFPMP